jgi:4-nitrophenyl phosphatase
MIFSAITTILLDGDGVLWRGDTPIPGIKDFFDYLAEKKINWALITNNNTRTAQDYVKKLQKFGIKADESIVFTSSTATAEYLLNRFGRAAPLHVVGMDGLTTTLRNAGFNITVGETVPNQKVAAVVAGMDRQINHEKIKVAMRLIMNGAEFVATNTDGSFPTPEGINPGTGMVIGALQATSNVEPTVIGKPQKAIFETALRRFNELPENALMVGDRLETDILGASRLGIKTVAVLTGVTSREEITKNEIKPDHIFEDISDFLDNLKEDFE